MGKITNNANIYNKEGKLIRPVNEDGKLEPYNVFELEELYDELCKEPHVNWKELQFIQYLLMQKYQKDGNPHEKEILEKLKEMQAEKEAKESAKTVEESLTETIEELENDSSLGSVSSDSSSDNINE